MPLGSLVKPINQFLYLTPQGEDSIEDLEKWPEWSSKDIGIVLSNSENLSQVLVMTPNGTGFCYLDEIRLVA